MRVLNDFKCVDCGLTKEYFVDNERNAVECQDCQGLATKVQRPIRSSLDPISGDFPGATMSWEKQREDKMKAEQKDSGYTPS